VLLKLVVNRVASSEQSLSESFGSDDRPEWAGHTGKTAHKHGLGREHGRDKENKRSRDCVLSESRGVRETPYFDVPRAGASATGRTLPRDLLKKVTKEEGG